MILSPDKRGQIDATVARNLLTHLPDLPVDVVPISYFPDFEFKEPITSRYILVDFMEPHAEIDRYRVFWDWVGSRQPILHFKRELVKSEAIGITKPIDWPCYVPIPPTQSEAEFDARPIEVFFHWGYSHPSRPLLHADIFKAMTTHGIEVVSSFEELEARKYNLPPRTWVSIHTHHSVRRPITEIMKWQQQAKISVSLYGNGMKSFRTTEAPIGAVMALPQDVLAWSFDWWDDVNCIKTIHDFISLELATKKQNLYDIYVAGQETIRKYEAKRYVAEYVVPAIETVL